MSTLVSLQNVVKRYKRGKQSVEVLHGVNLAIEQGEFLALKALGASQGGALAGRVLIGRDTGPAAEPHQAASRSASAAAASVAGAAPGRKPRI